MKRLSREGYARARHFLRTQARPLDWVLFEHRFEGAPAAAALAELARYQNDDGGFGRALEPDLRIPSSSALATGIALRRLQELGSPASHPLVRGAVDYLLATFDRERWVWRVAPPDANDFPHAPWWHDEDGSLARTFDGFLVIPRAEIVGLLHHFSAQVPENWLNSLTERTVNDIETIEVLGTGGGDDLVYALSLAETEELPEHFRGRLAARIRAEIPTAVSRDPGAWTSYCITPLKVAPSPQSMVADLLWDDLQVHLEHLIDRQMPAGTWDPVWTWGEGYPDAWAQAKQEWRGALTLETLIALQAFGRIEGR